MEFNDRLKESRKLRNLTQKEISKLMEITQQQYSKYERGINLMGVRTFKKVCITLKLSSEYLLGFTDTPLELIVNNNPKSYYNSKLKYIREYRGYSKTKVALYIGISLQQYSDYERGDYEMSIKYLTKICKCLNISPDYILGFIDEIKLLDKNSRDKY